MKKYRQIFLEEFLKLYSVKFVTNINIKNDLISGTAVYDPNNKEEKQDFCWHISDQSVPSRNALEIIKIITENNWCEIDKIIVTKDELFLKTGWESREKFNKSLAEIFNVEIRMVDDGEETDSFFIHF